MLYWRHEKKKKIYIYIYIYIYIIIIFFFGGLTVGGTKGKKNERKKNIKKNGAVEPGMGYCPFFFVLSHNTANCIVTQGAQQACMARQDTATIWPTGATIRPACAQGRAAPERGGGLASVGHDTIFVS